MLMPAASSELFSRVLLVAFFFLPFTSLRIGPVGPGEVFLLIAFLLSLYVGAGKMRLGPVLRPVRRFWVFYFLILFLGFFYNFFFLRHASGTIELATFDLAAYIFVFMLTLLLSNSVVFSPGGVDALLRKTVYAWIAVFIILFAISFFSSSLFGLPLRHYQNFTPLVDNVHQASMVICVLPFLALYLAESEKRPIIKLGLFLASGALVVMSFATGSTKAAMGVVMGIGVVAMFRLFYIRHGRHRAMLNIAFGAAGVAGLLAIFGAYGSEIIELSVVFFKESDPAQARQNIYADGFLHGLDSFLVGYGPGGHVLHYGRFWDAHNTVLTVFLQTGIVGLLVFFWYLFKVLRAAMISPALLAAFASLLVYVLGGDVLRRLPMWILFCAIFVFASIEKGQSRKEVDSPERSE